LGNFKHIAIQYLQLLKYSGIDYIFFSSPILAKMNGKYKNCQKCILANTRTNIVYGEGNENADLMLIGEAPGQDEDIIGRPFVGNAGQLLNKMLKAINIKREQVYITNIVKCRPPNNRNPLPTEINACLPYLYEQIEIIKPKIILALGLVSANTLLKTNLSLGELRKNIYNFKGIKLMVTYHPAALLYHPTWKKSAWIDLQKLQKEYEALKKK